MAANPLDEHKKVLGNRLLEERVSSEKTLARSAEQLGVTAKAIKSFESGRSSPSLPQIELLAALYRIPIEHVLGEGSELPKRPTLAAEKTNDFLEIRNRIIAATIKQQRLSQKKSIKKLAAAVGISAGLLSKFESAGTAIPQPVLRALCSQLEITQDTLLSPLTKKAEKVRTVVLEDSDATSLPDELKEFVLNPINLPYLELAKRLSAMDAAKLRAIAENLLEITY